jgi:SAM-dependent methyltransferase
MEYTERYSRLYGQLGITGTTYSVSLAPGVEAMGNLRGKTVLDLGAGTGRTARYLMMRGAAAVVAVDKSANMLACAKPGQGVLLCRASATAIPLLDSSVDAALCAYVFVEFPCYGKIAAACHEVHRVLKGGGTFVVIATNPESVGCDFVSYSYSVTGTLRSGDSVVCTIKGTETFEIFDRYWLESDYVRAFGEAGFVVTDTAFPRASQDSGLWLDEVRVAPDIVFQCRKAERNLGGAKTNAF